MGTGQTNRGKQQFPMTTWASAGNGPKAELSGQCRQWVGNRHNAALFRSSDPAAGTTLVAVVFTASLQHLLSGSAYVLLFQSRRLSDVFVDQCSRDTPAPVTDGRDSALSRALTTTWSTWASPQDKVAVRHLRQMSKEPEPRRSRSRVPDALWLRSGASPRFGLE